MIKWALGGWVNISQLTMAKPAPRASHCWESGLSSDRVESALGVTFIMSFRFMKLPQIRLTFSRLS